MIKTHWTSFLWSQPTIKIKPFSLFIILLQMRNHMKVSQVRNGIFVNYYTYYDKSGSWIQDDHTLYSKLPRWPSQILVLEVIIERENSRPITSWYVTLQSPQNTANYKVPRIDARFCYHYSKTYRNLSSVMQKPITHQHM